MTYEETPIKNGKGLSKQIKYDSLDKVNTGAILWHLLKRHKFALVATYAVVTTTLYFVPFLPDMIFSIFR